jgi:hypothetical protein
MKKLVPHIIGVALLCFLFIACPNNQNSGNGITITGTVSSSGFAIVTPATVNFSQGSQVSTITVPVSNSGISGVSQSGTYSVEGVSSGTYTIVITFTSNGDGFTNGYPQY